VFEVDHPGTQTWRRARLQEQGIEPPRTLSFVPADFESGSLGDRLRRAGFRSDAPVFVSWLGAARHAS
jgi:O-methyltransferase involved in polyketide biosynthesis